jgi:hypothetical protein
LGGQFSNTKYALSICSTNKNILWKIAIVKKLALYLLNNFVGFFMVFQSPSILIDLRIIQK